MRPFKETCDCGQPRSSDTRAQCPNCRRASTRRSYRKHRERRLADKANYSKERREELKAKSREWYANNKDRYKNYRLKKHFGITLDDYHKMLESQNGVCNICGSDSPGNRHKEQLFYVDHDHRTGKVRGLLCGPCNTALGLFKDDPTIILRAAEYVVSDIQSDG